MPDASTNTDLVAVTTDLVPAQKLVNGSNENESSNINERKTFTEILDQYKYGDVYKEWQRLEEQLKRHEIFFDDKKILTLYNATASDAKFVVDEKTTTAKDAKKLFSREASNPYSDMLYALFENDEGIFERPKPMAKGRYIPAGVLSIIYSSGEIHRELADDELLADVGWEFTVGVMGLQKCLPEVYEATENVEEGSDAENQGDADAGNEITDRPGNPTANENDSENAPLHDTILLSIFCLLDNLRFVGDQAEFNHDVIEACKERMTEEELLEVSLFYLGNDALIDSYKSDLYDNSISSLSRLKRFLQILKRTGHALSEAQLTRAATVLEKDLCGMLRISGWMPGVAESRQNWWNCLTVGNDPLGTVAGVMAYKEAVQEWKEGRSSYPGRKYRNDKKYEEWLDDHLADAEEALVFYRDATDSIHSEHGVFSKEQMRSRFAKLRVWALSNRCDVADDASGKYQVTRTRYRHKSFPSKNRAEIVDEGLRAVEKTSHSILSRIFGFDFPRISIERCTVKPEIRTRPREMIAHTEEEVGTLLERDDVDYIIFKNYWTAVVQGTDENDGGDSDETNSKNTNDAGADDVK